MTDDFSAYPPTIAELRSDRGDNTRLQPRDLLIDLLRKIDSKDIEITNLVIAWEESDKTLHNSAACTDRLTAIGLLAFTANWSSM